jgi:hypothetical protein
MAEAGKGVLESFRESKTILAFSSYLIKSDQLIMYKEVLQP